MLKPFFFKSRVTALVAWLILIMTVGPQLDGIFGFLWVTVSLAVIPFLGIYAVSENRRYMFIGIALGVPTFIAIIAWTLAGSSVRVSAGPHPIAALSFILYYGGTTVLILKHLIRQQRVTFDTLMGATAVYLLVGFTFAIAYVSIFNANPGAFNLPATQAALEFDDALYFSFVTLTTLGYGDIYPIAPLARSLTMLQSICGVLYLAIVISRFVSMYKNAEVADDEG